MAEREGTVFIAEDLGGEPYWFPGTFSAHWEAPRGGGYGDGPHGVSAEEAIAWAREQADRVLIRLEDSEYYSAGARPAADLEPWPEDLAVEPRREPGMGHLDLISEEPIAWEACLPRWVSRERTDADVARLQAALGADPDVSREGVDVKRRERVKAIPALRRPGAQPRRGLGGGHGRRPAGRRHRALSGGRAAGGRRLHRPWS